MSGGRFKGGQRNRAGSKAMASTSRNSERVTEAKEPSTERGNPQNPKSFFDNFLEFNNEPCFAYDVPFGYKGKMEIGREATFTTSAIALIDIADAIYIRLTAMSEHFAKSVSHAMFDYYAIQLYYMRICCIELSNGSQDLDVKTFAEYAKNNRWVIPQFLSDYLQSIGDFEDSTGLIARHKEIALPEAETVNGICGYFGQVNECTHCDYENRPAPGVIAQRICEDLYCTLKGDDSTSDWNLSSLEPDEDDSETPTVNLLGWAPACKLSEEQVNGLKMCGVMVTSNKKFAFPKKTKFCYNHDLMSYVDRRLYELTSKMPCTQGLNTKSNGSIVQQDFQVLSPIGSSDLLYFEETDIYGQSGIQNCGRDRLDTRQEAWAHIARFRLRKDSVTGYVETLHTWCCYRFKNYICVPEDWIRTRNMYFEFGSRNIWNVLRFQSASMYPRDAIARMLDKSLVDAVESFSY